MFKWLAARYESRRARLQSRLEDSLRPTVDPVAQSASADWRRRGNAHLDAGRLDAAADCYRHGIEADPSSSIFYSNLGYVLGELGRQSESLEMLLKAVQLDPADFDAHYMLGNIARARGEWLQAIASYRRALKINPQFDVCRRDLCVSLAQAGQIREARLVLDQGPAFSPDTVDYYFFRGNLQLAEEQFDAAIENFIQAAQLKPQDPAILINLGVAYIRKPDVFAAIKTYRRVLELEPTNVQAHANLAAAFQIAGQQESAVQSYRRALEINPEYLNAHQNLLFILTSVPGFSPAEYLQEARKYGARISARAKPYTQWLCTPPAHVPRPLRVGFVSGDLRNHPVGLFLEAILARVDSGKLTLIAYSSSVKEDAVSKRLKPLFSAWNPVAVLADEALADKIHRDRIDILIDLAGHTGLNRLPVFAWKPAPLQVAWLGYWATTGVTEIDYILVDPVSAPRCEAQLFSEALWYLPETRLCLSPPVTARPIGVQGLPALRNGHITFGSYQQLNKINSRTLAVWSRILARMPSARLRIQSLPLTYPDAAASMRGRLVAAGIAADRIDLCGGASRDDYLASYSQVDVVLDTFPFPGGTTTAEALWMGVPTVTLSGDSLLARQGASLMRCVGLADWVAGDEDEFVEIAVSRTCDLPGLEALRAGLRGRALKSPLFDAARFARNLEEALTSMTRSHDKNVEP